jgi:hypothetical protein
VLSQATGGADVLLVDPGCASAEHGRQTDDRCGVGCPLWGFRVESSSYSASVPRRAASIVGRLPRVVERAPPTAGSRAWPGARRLRLRGPGSPPTSTSPPWRPRGTALTPVDSSGGWSGRGSGGGECLVLDQGEPAEWVLPADFGETCARSRWGSPAVVLTSRPASAVAHAFPRFSQPSRDCATAQPSSARTARSREGTRPAKRSSPPE